MQVSTWVWFATLGGLMAILLARSVRDRPAPARAHRPRIDPVGQPCTSPSRSIFGLGVLFFSGPRYGGEFFAGWLTEYSLSVDNLFVFVIIMARFRVPREYQQKVLLIGIVLALVMRGIFIAARRGRDPAVHLGLLPVRRLPHLHGDQARHAR